MNVKLIVCTFFAATLIAGTAHATDPIAELQQCASIASDSERLQCFDALSASFAASADQPSEAEATASDGMSASLGGSKFEDSPEMDNSIGGAKFEKQENGDEPLATGTVNFCQKSFDGKWLFIFEGGQIWKQVRSKKRNFKNCGFVANIGKDFFGYYLQPEGSDERTRIERLK